MTAWVNGDATDLDAAVAAAAALLAGARAPAVAGLVADVAAIRAAYDLAARIGASVDTAGGAGTYAELGALSRVGALRTTPAEAVGRADAVLAIGAAPWGAPILGALSGSKPTRGRAAGAERVLLAVGGGAAAAPTAVSDEAGHGLPEAVARLRAHARGHLAGDGPSGRLAKALAAARYAVLVYDPAELGEVGVETIQGLAVDLSGVDGGEAGRCFTLALAGPDQDRAVVSVSAWTTGQAPRCGFGRGVPEHDPWRFDAARQAAAGEIDAALWLASLPAPRPDWLAAVPSVALVCEAEAGIADVVIAVASPGRDGGGVLWDGRRGALAYYPPSAPADRPAAASVLRAIASRPSPVRDGAARRSLPAC